MIGRLKPDLHYTEEPFGILTDDDLYLDCVLIRPRNTSDADLKVLRVWVPRYPLTKTSTIVCARQEVQSYGPNGTIAHLVFDLRGTGESEGAMLDKDFKTDLKSIKAWSDERFGTAINLGFLGSPELSQGARVNMIPIRPGVVMETYYYPTAVPNNPTLLYLATYGNFDRTDDTLCQALSQAGYEVYGLDPLRYLLHASTSQRLTPKQLASDLATVCEIIDHPPTIIGEPISAGLALLWTALHDPIKGVIAIGRASPAFRAKHIFDLDQEQNFNLTRYSNRITPRPLTLIWQEGHPLGGDKTEMAALYQNAGEPRQLQRTSQLTPPFLLAQLQWQASHGAPAKPSHIPT
jgi:hypothetical protein